MATAAENRAALRTAWEAEIANIQDAVENAEATVVLDRYIDALEKQHALEAGEILSYSMGGRTVTRRDARLGQSLINDLGAQLRVACYGRTVLIDMGMDEDDVATS